MKQIQFEKPLTENEAWEQVDLRVQEDTTIPNSILKILNLLKIETLEFNKKEIEEPNGDIKLYYIGDGLEEFAVRTDICDAIYEWISDNVEGEIKQNAFDYFETV